MHGWTKAASRGALIGGAAGLVMALGDFGASWLWLVDWRDRWELLLRLLAIEVPVGALAGALLAVVGTASRPAVERLAGRLGKGEPERVERWQGRLWPVPLLLLGSPGFVAVAVLLFSGGSASKLPARPALVAAAALCLLLGSWVALRLGAAVLERARRAPRKPALGMAAGLFVLYLVLSKADQTLYPKLYEYLHTLLTVACFGIAGLAVAVVALHSPRARALDARGPRVGLATLGVLLVLFGLGVVTLERNQNVRVALFDPRAASSRSLMQGLEPVLPSLTQGPSQDALARARAARAKRRRAGNHSGLPIAPDAHVLLVSVDALRPDHLGAYGYERDTSPYIDSLAREAVVFERAYAQAPHSSYSLCSLMTSEYLHETVDIGKPLPETTLADTLNESGIYTAGFYTQGIFHTEGERLQPYHDDAFGFARYDHHDVLAEEKTDMALEEIDRLVERGEPPSFLWVHYFDVHEPYRETRFGKSPMDRYDSEIRKVDGEVKRLLTEARERLDRDVIVVLTADHGEEFRDHGGLYHGSTLYDEQIQVPLIVQAPGLEPTRVDAPVEMVDIAPTILGLLDLPVPASMRGDDLRLLATGKVDSLGPAFAGVMYKRMVVRDHYKLVADLRFDLFEVYDLEKDPHERNNLASAQPELLDSLKGEVYAWLDSLEGAPEETEPTDPRELALARGRLNDRRAVEPLGELVQDASAPRKMRVEAARLLGKLADDAAAPALVEAMDAEDDHVAAEAAIALGRMKDPRARDSLRQLVHGEDPALRSRAAVSLGRLRDPEAVPALIDALWAAEDKYDRQEAVRWLGRLQDPRAVEPLLRLLSEFKLRRLAVIALGDLGDPRAYEPLVEVLDWEYRPSIRDAVARALGKLGDPRGIEPLARLAATEPNLENPSESLVRLGAVGEGAVGGTDVAEAHASRLRGMTDCHAGDPNDDWDYRERTWCATEDARAALRLEVPESVAGAEGAFAVLRLKRHDGGEPVKVTVELDGSTLGSAEVDGQWAELRWEVDRGALAEGPARAVVTAADEDARLALDHFLLVPEPPTVASR